MISTAAIGDELIPAFRRARDNELVAVASRERARAEDYARQHAIPQAYEGYTALLDDGQVDAVYIALPNALHGEWVRRALEAGKHVLCEKPLTPTAGEAKTLFDLANDRGLVLAEAFMYRHHPKTLRVRDLLSEGAIGELRTVRCSFSFKVAEPATDIRYSSELSGGALRDVGCYCVSFATFAADDEPEEVQGYARRASTGVDEAFYGTLGFGNGVTAQFDCALDVQLNLGATLVGSDGFMHIPMPWYAHREPLVIRLQRNGDVMEVPTPGDNAYLLEIEDLADAVNGAREPRISPDETVRNLRVIERLRDAAGLD
jgi:D-xylose 1-dehydrogenase (NADP+, D-xylono-1,5-lactone-forming)